MSLLQNLGVRTGQYALYGAIAGGIVGLVSFIDNIFGETQVEETNPDLLDYPFVNKDTQLKLLIVKMRQKYHNDLILNIAKNIDAMISIYIQVKKGEIEHSFQVRVINLHYRIEEAISEFKKQSMANFTPDLENELIQLRKIVTNYKDNINLEIRDYFFQHRG